LGLYKRKCVNGVSVNWKTWATMLLILACAGVASAGSIGLTFINDFPTQRCTMDPAPSPYNTSTQFYVGRSNFQITVDQPDPTDDAAQLLAIATGNGGSIQGYCIDTSQFIANGDSYVWDVVNMNSDPLGAPTLGNNYSVAETKVRDLQGLFARHGLTANPTADEAAAMAAAVWEIVNEKTGTSGGSFYDISGGSFEVNQVTGNWASMSNQWLSDLSMPAGTQTPILYALVDPVVQDFVVGVAAVQTLDQPVPEPLTMASALLAICGLGAYIRRRTGRSAA